MAAKSSSVSHVSVKLARQTTPDVVSPVMPDALVP